MKLRVRSTETKETIRVETLNSSSLLDLKTLISSKISSSSPPFPPQSILLSLNQKEELAGDGDLQSLGLTSGDLIFYTISQAPALIPDQSPNSQTLAPNQTLNPTTNPNSETLIPDRRDMEVDMEEETLSVPGNPVSEAPSLDTDEGMELGVEESECRSQASIPCFLRRVMELEKDGIKGNLGYLVVAVHAVFLESGFVVCDGIESSRLPKDWNLATTAISIRYTVPELKDLIGNDEKVAVLKFSMTGKFVSVYGFLSGVDGPDVFRLCLDSSKVMPLADLVSPDVEKEKEVFNLWKVVKDGLCLPLLIKICEKNGLPFPPCFARLPTDVKIMILELLPGVDVARVGCASSELQYLSDNDELWKQKFMEEFGLTGRAVAAAGSWKKKFKKKWVEKRDDAEMRVRMENVRRLRPRIGTLRNPPFAPLRFPSRWIGGDYDALPFFGGSVPLGGLGFPQPPRRRNVVPRYNLGYRGPDFFG